MEIGSSASAIQLKITGAILGKMKDQMNLEGEQAIKLIDSAMEIPQTVPPPGTGTTVDTTA
ncbi:MAG: hypothetical protein JXR95_14985 [Deltaproteobacteria bacterium]|nr:hypothetical protein [Deltaproteobacteria bacterium]